MILQGFQEDPKNRKPWARDLSDTYLDEGYQC